jgi:hypothetical protein
MKKIVALIVAIALMLTFTVPVMAQTGTTGTASVTNHPPTLMCNTFNLKVAGPPANPGMKWDNMNPTLPRGNNPYCFSGETFSATVMAHDPNGDVDLENGIAKLYVDYDPQLSNWDYVMEYNMGSIPNSGNQFETVFHCTDIPILGGGNLPPNTGINWHIEVSVIVWDSAGQIMTHSAFNPVDECEIQAVLNPTFGITTPQNVVFAPGPPASEQPGAPQVTVTAVTQFNVSNTYPGYTPPSGCVLIDILMQASDMTVPGHPPAGGGNVIQGYAMEAQVVAQGGTPPTAVGNYVGGGEAGFLAPVPGGGLPCMSQAQATGSLAHGNSVVLDFFIDLPAPLAPATYVGNIYYYVEAV